MKKQIDKKIRKYGYVIELSENQPPKFYQKKAGVYSGTLRTAVVVGRNMAYTLRYDNETVRKVELFKNGKPKRIIPLKTQ